MYLIYKHTNKTTNKSYIGQTIRSIEDRWKQHINSSKKGDDYKFQRAIRKYGINDWEHEVIEDNIESLDEANEAEQFWIHWYDTCENGYNVTSGGKRCKLSSESREKMKRSHVGKKLSQETRDKISASCKGKKNPQLSERNKNRKGVWKQSDIGKEKISKSSKGKKQSREHVRNRMISRNGVEPR